MLLALPGAQKALDFGAHLGTFLVPLLITSEFRPGAEIPSWTDSSPSRTELFRPGRSCFVLDGVNFVQDGVWTE